MPVFRECSLFTKGQLGNLGFGVGHRGSESKSHSSLCATAPSFADVCGSTWLLAAESVSHAYGAPESGREDSWAGRTAPASLQGSFDIGNVKRRAKTHKAIPVVTGGWGTGSDVVTEAGALALSRS